VFNVPVQVQAVAKAATELATFPLLTPDQCVSVTAFVHESDPEPYVTVSAHDCTAVQILALAGTLPELEVRPSDAGSKGYAKARVGDAHYTFHMA
jgi:hypothetical protein